jgi:homoserine kinase
MTITKVFVPGTIGNIGPGFDVLGLAVDGLGDQLHLELIEGPSVMGDITGMDAELIPRDPQQNIAILAADALLRKHGSHRGVKISLHRQLPVSGGLGASAAASVGAVLAVDHALKLNLNKQQLMEAALVGEEFVAGRHLDNIAPCVLGGLSLVLSIDPIKTYSLPTKKDWWISLVTPKLKLDTKKSRQVLPDALLQKDWVEVMAHAIGVSHGLGSGDLDLLTSSLKDPYAEPRRAPLVPGFFDAQEAALKAGSLGCSLSGAGPTIFALCPDEKTAHVCLDRMKSSFGDVSLAHIGNVSREGARIL